MNAWTNPKTKSDFVPKDESIMGLSIENGNVSSHETMSIKRRSVRMGLAVSLALACALGLSMLIQGLQVIGDLTDTARRLEVNAFDPHLSSMTSNQVHILYGVSGNDTDMFHELEISLKSVLMNAPVRSGM